MNPLQFPLSGALSSLLQNDTNHSPMPKYKFSCKNCDFYTNKSCNYIQHIKTKKHEITCITNPAFGGKYGTGSVSTNTHTTNVPVVYTMDEQDEPYEQDESYEHDEHDEYDESRKTYSCKNCNKPYFSKKGVWQHMKKCKHSDTQPALQTSPAAENKSHDTMTAFMLEVMKATQTHMLEVINVVVSSMKSNTNFIVPDESFGNQASLTSNANASVNGNGNMTNVNNSNNTTFNLNMFLNETCKDAMNMSDFVKTIELNTNDMENVGKNGFVKGISKIFIDNLEKTDITKRPIHCSDIKREVMYVKDDDKWDKGNIDSRKLVDAVRVIEQKNVILINNWAKEHPECGNSDTQANSIYMTLVKTADGTDSNIINVIKQVAKKVTIDKNEINSM